MTHPFPSVQDARRAKSGLGRLESSDLPEMIAGSEAFIWGSSEGRGWFCFCTGGPQCSPFRASAWQLSNSTGSCV